MLGTKIQKTVKTIKDELTENPILAYFGPEADYIIHVDGPMMGLGAMLHQKGKAVIYASRT